jgi:hypothetical protein
LMNTCPPHFLLWVGLGGSLTFTCISWRLAV